MTSPTRRLGQLRQASIGSALVISGRVLLSVLALLALVAFFGRGAPSLARPAPLSVAEAPGERYGAREWHVGVDGWQIEVDGVVMSRSATAAEPQVFDDRALRLAKLALYADSIGRYSVEESIDWRLIAAVIAAESGFDASALSPAGAFGLMQVKEVAALEVGVFPYEQPDANIRAGVRYLAAMRERFPALQQRDRLALMLAAYNMGPGHLSDAQQLAQRLGRSPERWDAMAPTLFLLEQPAIHTELRYGYAQGAAVVRYVESVLAKYGAYQERFPSSLAPSTAMLAEIASR